MRVKSEVRSPKPELEALFFGFQASAFFRISVVGLLVSSRLTVTNSRRYADFKDVFYYPRNPRNPRLKFGG
jgi:hypothetical protein